MADGADFGPETGESGDAEDIDAWQTLAHDPTRGGPHLGRLIEAVRAVQDAVVEAAAPERRHVGRGRGAGADRGRPQAVGGR